MNRSSVYVRIAISVAPAVGASAHAPVALQAVLGIAALINTADLLGLIWPDRDAPSRWLIGVAGVAVGLIVSGLVVDHLPGGLTRGNWAAAWAVLSLVLLGVVWRRGWPTLGSGPSALPLRPVLGALVVGVIVASAFAVATAGVADQNRQPSLALSVLHFAAQKAVLLVQADSQPGVYTVNVSADGSRRSPATVVRVPTGSNAMVKMTVSLPSAQRYWKVMLNSVGPRRPQDRFVVLWKDAPSAS